MPPLRAPVIATAEGSACRTPRPAHWRRWGPYLSEREWGTVREDYSPDGAAWDYFPHDHARSRAYRWGEDGIAGFCDDTSAGASRSRCGTAGPDPQGAAVRPDQREGNHGEDVKELYYYLDGTPTHSYMRMLYKYPQRAFPVRGSRRRKTRAAATDTSLEYEILDTGVFDDDRYFDVIGRVRQSTRPTTS